MSGDLRERLVAVLPLKPSSCPDPQCGDSTWDHDCQLGPDVPNEALAARVVAVVADWLRTEADKARSHGALTQAEALEARANKLTEKPWTPGTPCASCFSEDTYLNDDGHPACRGCGRSDDDDD